MKKYFLLITIIIAHISCSNGPTVLDATDQKSFDESFLQMEHELSSDQAPKLEEAFNIILKYNTKGGNYEDREAQVRQLLNGKNADDVFRMAERIAQQENIKWNRNSRGYLNLKMTSDEVETTNINKGDEVLKQAVTMEFSTKQIDQNHDGIYDALMVFIQFKNKEGQSIDFQDSNISAVCSVFQNEQQIFSKNQKLTNSKVGKPAFDRGVILPYSAFDAERINGDEVEISIKAITPYNHFQDSEPNILVNFEKYAKNVRVDQEQYLQEKEMAQSTVVNFLTDVGHQRLQAAHQYSVNPEWRNMDQFTSKNLGFGAVKGCQIESVKVKNLDLNKDKATVDARYIFEMEGGNTLELHKDFSLQKIAGEWKIVGTKKLN